MNSRTKHNHAKKTCWSILINTLTNLKLSHVFIWYLLLSNQFLLAKTQNIETKNDKSLISHDPLTKEIKDSKYESNNYYSFNRQGCFSKKLPQKSFLIKGGTEENRELRLRKLIHEDVFLMYASYKSQNEIAVIFSDKHSDFKGMTFEKAKAIAGDISLGSKFKTETFSTCQYGVIDVSEWEHSVIDQLRFA